MKHAGRFLPRRLRQTLRRRFARPRRGAVILAYHRIADVSLDPSGLSVGARRFAEQMAALVRVADPVPLAHIAAGRRHGRHGRTAVAVTFDDGYLDNLVEAKPVLDRLGVPATVFVPTAVIGRNAPSWWDELEAMVFGAATLPPDLDLVIGGQRLVMVVCDDGGVADHGGRYREWRVWSDPASTPRQRLYTRLWQVLRALPAAEQEIGLNALAAWCGYDRQRPPSHPTLDVAGVRALIAGSGIELGGHTLSHAPLVNLPADRQREEIEANKRSLEALAEVKISAFSYPYGLVSDDVAHLVREVGFTAAVTTAGGAVTARTDSLRLPRLAVGDWDGEVFTAELSRLLHR